MMKNILGLFILPLVLVVACLSLRSSPASAYSNTNLIDNVIFDNDSSMSSAQIDSWLNSNFPSSCISSNSGFTAPDPSGYSPNYPHVDGKYLYGSPVTAGKVIYDAAVGHGINPQVLITKLQNEEQLVDGSAGCTSTWRYASAVGYACTDSDTFSHNYTYTGEDPYSNSSALPTPIYYRNGVAVNTITGSCVNTNVFAGFSEQVVHAAWFLSSSRHKAEGDTGWAAITGNWNHCDDNNTCPASYNIPASWGCYSGYMTQGTFKRCPTDSQAVFYDGYAPIDGKSIHLDNGATAALYRYTPHFQSFDNIFTPWFGPTLTSAYTYSFVSSSSATLHFEPGQSRTSNTVTIKNVGSSTWYADGNVPSGQHAVRLVMRNYRNNPFADTSDLAWLSTQNQIKMTPSSVAPGQNATFTFNLKSPSDSMVGSPYIMYFLPAVDGVTLMPDVNMGFTLYDDPPTYSVVSSPININLQPNQSVNQTVQIKNNSASTWYADGSVPGGGHAFRLALAGYQNTAYADASDSSWMSTQNQIKMTPSSVAPGQTATFTFRLHAPLRQVSQTLNLIPVVDGLTFLNDQIPSFKVSNPAPQYAYSYVTATNPPSTMHPGDTASVSLTLLNKGNVVWSNESTPGAAHLRLMMIRPSYRSSAFYDPTAGGNWLAPSQVQYTGTGVGLNGSVMFTFNWKAPNTPGTYVEYFAPVLDGYYQYPDIGMGFAVTVSP